MGFDIRTVPFSQKGSYLVLSWIENGIYIRNIHGGDTKTGALFKLIMQDAMKQSIDYSVVFEPHRLLLHHKKASISIGIEEKRISMTGEHCTLCLEAVLGKYDHINTLATQEYELHSYTNETKARITVITGTGTINSVWDSIGNTTAVIEIGTEHATNRQDSLLQYSSQVQADVHDSFELIIENYTVVPPNDIQYSAAYTARVQEKNLEEYTQWKQILLKDSDIANADVSELASYILWSSFVSKEGILPYQAMYMSKNWMTNIWSWDNCFNAICLAKNYPELAYQQFIFFKEFQHSSGALPDFVNDTYASYSCVKPPIHGWAYMLMMKQNAFFTQQSVLQETYDMLSNMHEYWTTQRVRKYPLPYYNHGNDSGWDNATVFIKGCPVISPDLPCYLIVLQKALSTIAMHLNKNTEAQQWQALSKEYLQTFLTTLFDGKEFFSLLYETGEKICSKSLLHCMPIIIGDMLPATIRSMLVNTLQSHDFLSEFGIASEAITSNYYTTDGYWRGNIWPLTTLPIVDALHCSGYSAMAKDIALRFMHLVHTGGMAENFDAISGKGLSDPAFTFTASTYLYFQRSYYNK